MFFLLSRAACGTALLGALVAVSAAQAQVQLKPVVVTATRFPETADALAQTVSVITAKDIANAGVESVSQAIMKLLGVPGRLDLSGGNNYGLDLRGFGASAGSNQVVMVDGLRLNEADLSNANLSSIPIESVEKIEILRGTGAVLYGEGATGGVIVVTTKAGAGVQRRSGAQLSAHLGSEGFQDLRASAVLVSGGVSLDASASQRRSDGHRENFASQADTQSASVQWGDDWLRLGARLGRNKVSSGLPGSLTAAQYAADPHQASRKTDSGATQNDNAGVFVQAVRGAWEWAADVSRRAKQYRSFSFGSAYGYDVLASNASLRARHRARLSGVDNAMVVGLDLGDWERMITQSSFTPVGTRAQADSRAVYLRNQAVLSASATTLSLGARAEVIEKSEAASATQLSETQRAWELGLSQPLGTAWTVYGHVGSSYRLANVDEFSFSSPGTPVRAQTSRDVELGARWRLASTQVEMRWYRSALSNEIAYDSNAAGPYGPGTGANVNLDPTRREGLELEFKQAVNAGLDLRLNAALREARFLAGPYAGRDVALVPHQTLALQVDWRPTAGHSLNAGLNLAGMQYPDFANTCSMPGYATLDLRYAYQTPRVEWALAVANALDAKYYAQAVSCAAGQPTSIYPEAGRRVNASVTVRF